ncbi:MAG TPA: endonuclease [Bacteroides sp.]|nr:endonuclease [Bacteroides sp.]
MKNFAIVILILSFSASAARAQGEGGRFIVVSYNVENLFDTADAKLFDDDAFTPNGAMEWTHDRYEKKLTDLVRVILSIPEKELPAIIGLTEVENKQVLEDMIQSRGLRRADYRIVHEEGDDPRGIECALLYRPDLFRYISHEIIPIQDPVEPDYRYRGILHIHGNAPDGSSLHLFINHWKSRSEGVGETERKRMFSAITLRRSLDMLLSRESGYKVIIMGDFNDEPTNRSIASGIAASNKRRNIYLGDHYNLFYDLHNIQGKGSYNYRGDWNMLDQIIVSYNLLEQDHGLSTGYESGKILNEAWMMTTDEKNGISLPAATYRGKKYMGGPSDHLPLYVVFTW